MVWFRTFISPCYVSGSRSALTSSLEKEGMMRVGSLGIFMPRMGLHSMRLYLSAQENNALNARA